MIGVIKRAIAVVMVSAALAACVGVAGTAGVTSAAPAPAPIMLPPGITLPPLPAPFDKLFVPYASPQKKLASSFTTVEKSMRAKYPGQFGVSIVPIGGDTAWSYGGLKTGRAWSTLKVPVSLAAERKNGAAVAEKEDKAITFSDNDAAGDLWGSLGGGRSSVDAVSGVLREGHDTVTRVSSEIDNPPSYPGYTPWSLADQATFGAHLPCLPGSEHVIRLMSSVAPNQQWGIARVGRDQGAITAVKGGWGPAVGADRGMLVRQLGFIGTTKGQVAVSMAAIPRSGKFEDGTAMLNQMGMWLSRNLVQLPMGRCTG